MRKAVSTSRTHALASACALLVSAGCGGQGATGNGDVAARTQRVLDVLASRVQAEAAATALDVSWSGRRPVVIPTVAARALAAASSGIPDGVLLGRERLGTVGTAALDIVAYASSGLVVAGLLCFPDDGARHSAVVHVHGGLGGIFDGNDPGILRTCLDWAATFGRTAFVPSLRGQDGGEGRLELCLGEADDVAAGAALLRSLDATDAQRVAIVGGSLGACVALRAAAKVPSLRAVVAYAPPTDWRGLVAFHRDGWAPATETDCDGGSYAWSHGGPAFADTIDGIICGHPRCPDADYDARSPLPGAASQSAPTLVAVAGADNIVPPAQQLLWHSIRSQAGHPVTVLVREPCEPWSAPPRSMDLLVYVPTAFHRLSPNVVITGLLFMLAELDGSALPAR